MDRLISFLVEAEVPKKMIAKVIVQVEDTESASFHLTHFKEQNTWVASCKVIVPKGKLVSYKLFMTPIDDDLNVEHLSPHGWVDLHNVWEEDHTVVITKTSYLKAYKPSVVTGFEDANMIFFNQINPTLVSKKTLISMAGSGPKMNDWNHQKYVIGFGHGRSITAVKAKSDSVLEYKNVIGLEHATRLWESDCYTDYVNSLRWEGPAFVNKKVTAPSDGVMRLVTSHWGHPYIETLDIPVIIVPSVAVAPQNPMEFSCKTFENLETAKDEKVCDSIQPNQVQKKVKFTGLRRIFSTLGKKVRNARRFIMTGIRHKSRH